MKICRRAGAASRNALYLFRRFFAGAPGLNQRPKPRVTAGKGSHYGTPSMETPGSQIGERTDPAPMHITIAVVGGNTVAGHALSLLLKGAGYETKILKVPPAGPEDLPGVVDLLLVSPGLRNERRVKILAALRRSEQMLRIPVLAFSSAIEEGLFGEEGSGAMWPVEIGGLARAIEAVLGEEAEIGSTFVADPVGEAALP